MNRYRTDGAEGITEDVDFAYKLNKLGVKQWLDPTVQCAHFKEMNLNEVHLYGNQRAATAHEEMEARYTPKFEELLKENERLRMKLLMKSGRRPKTPEKKIIIAPN